MLLCHDGPLGAVLSKIYDFLTAPDSVNAAAAARHGRPCIVFARPHLTVDRAGLAFGDLSTKEQIAANARFSALVNGVPGPTEFYDPSGVKIWEVYRRALEQAELPEVKLTEREKLTFAKATSFLYFAVANPNPYTGDTITEVVPTPQYATYAAHYAAYLGALRAYNFASVHARPDARLAESLHQAYERWGAAGYRDSIERAQDDIARLAGKGAPVVNARLRASLATDARKDPATGQTYYATFGAPSDVLAPAHEELWTRCTFSERDLARRDCECERSHEVAARASFATAAAAGARDEAQVKCSDLDVRGMSFSLDLMEVPLIRPWLAPAVLAGGARQDPRGLELAPLLPRSILLARNARLGLDAASESNRAVLNAIAASRSASYGPFLLKETSAAAAQIVAFLCDAFPKAPNPELPSGF